MRPEKLGSDAVAEGLKTLDGWSLSEDGTAISKRFQFKTFRRAFAFMTEIAMVAEKRDHHPEWSNVYNRVDVTLTTHDAGGITELDFKLAEAMDKAAAA